MSSKQSYDDDSDKSDSLICGFGPRRGNAESIDGDSATAGASLGDNDSKEVPETETLNANLICGFGRGGDGGSFASSGPESTGSEMLAALMEDEPVDMTTYQIKQQLGNGDQSQASSRAAANGTGATSPNNNIDSKNERDEDNYDIQIQHVPISVPTKTGDSSSGPRRGISRISSNRSVGSDGGMSMASEDAIVLMSNMLDNSDRSNDTMSDGEEEIIGRVYKKKPNDNYD